MSSTSRSRSRVVAPVAAALVLGSAVAHAQNSAVAEALFQDAQRLFEAGHVHEACAKFDESLRSDPGLGTLLRLALCHEREGKTATAWAEFEDAAAQAQRKGEADRESFARTHAAALDKGLNRVVIQMATLPRDLRLTVDGGAVGSGILDTAFPLDPGSHVIEASAPGKRTWTTKVTLEAGGVHQNVQVPPLEDDVPTAATAPAQPETPPQAPAAFPTRTVAVVTGGAGIALLGLATYFQLTALSHYDESRSATDATRSRQLYSDASNDQLYAQVTGAVGLAAVGAGVVLFVMSGSSPPPGKRPSVVPAVGPGGAGVVVRATW